MLLSDTRKALTREKRNGAISHYHGTLSSLLEDSSVAEMPQRVRTLSQSSPGEIIYALQAVIDIPLSAVVVHGGVGCSASLLWFNQKANYYSTNLNESDTILGGDEKLKSAITRAFRENHPEAIFIIGTPINAINNDDVTSVIIKLEQEFNCAIIYIDVNGFKTKNALSGYDAVYHSLLKHLVRPKESPIDKALHADAQPFINLVSLSENPRNVAVIADLLRRLDITCNICPRLISGIQKASEARFSVSLDDGENEYFLQGLNEVFGVPWLKTEPPIGAVATGDFIRKIAEAFGCHDKAEKLIVEEEQKIISEISKKPLGGKKVFLNTSLHRVSGFVSLIENLGGEVSGLAFPCLDSANMGKLKALTALPKTLPVIIAHGQQFELVNTLAKNSADFYFGASENAAVAARSGAHPLVLDTIAFYGYKGIAELVYELQRPTPGFLAHSGGVRYAESWLKRSGNWYVKVEVK